MKNILKVNMVSESDITVQAHGVHTAYTEMARALERRSDVKLIRGQFDKQLDVDIVHFHSIGLAVLKTLLQKNVKKVISAHIIPASLVGSIVMAKYWSPLAKRYMKWFYNRGDKVLAVSKTVADVLENDLDVPKEKIEVLYNTIDMSRYVSSPEKKKHARERLGIRKNAFVVIGNGQVQPRKRLDIFVNMAKQLPDVHFVWVGGIPFKHLGADYAAMQKLMTSAPANLKITGVIPHEDVAEYLAAADVFCLPAEQENHPMAVLEAAGAGLPIVLRDITEYDDTFAGDAIMCRDAGFTNAIVLLRDNNDEYKKAQKNSARIAKRFDTSTMAERLVGMYRDLL